MDLHTPRTNNGAPLAHHGRLHFPSRLFVEPLPADLLAVPDVQEALRRESCLFIRVCLDVENKEVLLTTPRLVDLIPSFPFRNQHRSVVPLHGASSVEDRRRGEVVVFAKLSVHHELRALGLLGLSRCPLGRRLS